MSQIFLHDVRHGHAQAGREILHRHSLLFLWVFQKLEEAICKSLGIPWRIKFDGEFFGLCHLPEIRYVGADNRHAVRASQMRYAAAPRGRRVRHHRDSRTLEQICQIVLSYISAKFDAVLACALLLHRLDVAGSLRMISARNYQSGFRHFFRENIECLDHQPEALVGAPLPEG